MNSTWSYSHFLKWVENGYPIDPSVTCLSILYKNLNFLPMEIGNLLNLKILHLGYNLLTSLPVEIGNLPNLKKLNLSKNKLTSLPVEIGNLLKLEELYLDYNQLTYLPVEIGNLLPLQELYLENNQLTSLPVEIGNLLNLKLLYLVNNQITSLPVEIGSLLALEMLDLRNNQLTSLPVEIGNLLNLKMLNLENNQLTSLPVEIGNLPNLKELYLEYNQLTSLPVEIGNLTNLEFLYLGHNNITSLPVEIGNLQNLKVLNLENNLLISLPVEIRNLLTLVELSLRDNNLTTIPAEIGNLYTHPPYTFSMDISRNPIVYIPPNIERFLVRQKHAQGIYQDTQSVHNSTVQKTIKESIMRLLSNSPVLTSEAVLESIISDDTITTFTKQSLLEYSKNTDLISGVSVTFLEVLTAVWNRIVINEHSTDIKNVLNDEMADAECKCFTGRVSRLVNCLSGVDELVEVKIADNEQIGNVISVVGDRLTAEGRYSTSLHKEIAFKELKELGYKEEVVSVWLDYIE